MKFLKIFLTTLTFIALQSSVFAETAPTVTPYGTFLKGDGVEIEMAQFAEKNSDGLNDVLLKISGSKAFNAGIDGKIIKYHAVHAGTGIDYQNDGFSRLILRQPYGDSWSLIQVFLDGKTVTVYEDKTQSKKLKPASLLSALRAAEKK